VATNVSGAVTSSVATLTIAANPLILGQSSTNSLQLYSGHNRFGMSVDAVGAAPLYYFWRANGVAAAITTNSGAIVFSNRTVTAVYDCVVSNSFGTAPSSPMSVTIVPPPTSPYAVAVLALNPFAYWPLSETSGGTAYDYLSGNNGSLINGAANGQPGPGFGFGTPSYAYAFSGASEYVDIPGGPVNLTGPLSLVAWVNGGGSGFETVAGKGDTSYRFDMETDGTGHFANGTGSDAIGGPKLHSGGVWHQMVGVYDASTTNVYLYIDGVRVNTQQAGTTPGSALDFWIGGAPDYGTRYFAGSVAQVALFDYALTATQVQNLFVAAETPPYIVTNPTNFTGNAGGSVTFRVAANGAPTLQYQWSGPGGVISGATNPTVTLNNLNLSGTPPNGGPGNYFCTITNLYGVTNSANAALAVISSSPFFLQDLALTNYGIVGSTATLSVVVGGNEPFTNGWYFGATPLHDGDRGGRISGATNLTLAIANAQTSDNGPYQIFVTNGVSPFFAASTQSQLVIENEPRFNGDGSGWVFNNGGIITSDVLTLTDGNNGEFRTVWFNTPVYIRAFKASFTYQAAQGSTGTTLADGVTFCLQNSPAGVNALGGGGGSLAYQGIPNSAAIAIDLFNARGYQYVTGGANPAAGTYVGTAPAVDPGSGHPIKVTLVYTGNTLALTLTDTSTLGTISTNLVIGSLSSVVGGDTALIGFTGATGGDNAIQTISAFSFVPLPALSVARNGSNGVVLSWPAGVGGYVLQKNSALNNAAGWTTIAGPYNIVGVDYQVTVAPATGAAFYRLVVTP
jgi:hypothetical protein